MKPILILLVWGTNDTWIPLKSGTEFHKQIKRAKLELIEGAGHCSMETNPIQFNKSVLTFLE